MSVIEVKRVSISTVQKGGVLREERGSTSEDCRGAGSAAVEGDDGGEERKSGGGVSGAVKGTGEVIEDEDFEVGIQAWRDRGWAQSGGEQGQLVG